MYEFGSFCVDTEEQLLLREGRTVPLTPRVYETLLVLLGSNGRLLTKDELMQAIWPDTIVEEVNLAHNISELRKALGDTPEKSEYIQTLPRRGYRFIAEVREYANPDGKAARSSNTNGPTLEARDQILREDETKSQTTGTRRRSLVIAMISSVVLFAIVFSAAHKWLGGSRSTPNLRSIAVLPFKPLAVTNRDESLELGMADTLIARLSGVGEVEVRPLSSVRRFGGLEQDPISAGKELKVDAVLDGTIQRTDDRIRMTVQLISVTDGGPVWIESFDEKFTNIFEVQDAVSRRVAAALRLRLGGEKEARLTKRYTNDAEAYQLYLKGQYFWNKFTPESTITAISYFDSALSRDHNYASAYVGLAKAYGVIGANAWLPPRDAFQKSQAAAKKALEIDEGLAEAHSALGAAQMFYDWDWTSAERELKRALDLRPDDPNSRRVYSYLLTAMGRFDEAIAQAELNQRQFDPLSPVSYADLVRAFYFARRYDEALEANRKAQEMDPNFMIAHIVAAAAYEQKRRYDEAITELQQGDRSSGIPNEALAALGHALAVSGKTTEALKTLKELRQISAERYVSPLDLAMIYAGLDARQQALEQLERAASDRVGWLINLKVEPRFDKLRQEPRYLELLKRLGLST